MQPCGNKESATVRTIACGGECCSIAFMRLCVLLLIAVAGIAAPPQNPMKPFEPLLAYDGTWRISRTGAAKPQTLVDKCSMLGSFFACAQEVDGQTAALVIFVRHGEAGHYQVQTIMPTGRATGLTDLQVNGDTWTYFTQQTDNGVTTHYKTVNVFSGKNKIHFESSHSSDGTNFTVDASGDEVKVTR